jgi:putative effector of murein hydrolase
MPFEKTVNQALLNANVFQNPRFRQAWEKGEIDENILLKLLGKSTVRISSIIYNKWHLIKKAMLKQPS